MALGAGEAETALPQGNEVLPLHPDARREAQHLLAVLNGRALDQPVWFDMEDADGYKKKHGFPFTKRNVSAITQAFVDEIRASGRLCGVYASKSWLTDYIKVDADAVWVAQWADTLTYNGQYDVDWNGMKRVRRLSLHIQRSLTERRGEHRAAQEMLLYVPCIIPDGVCAAGIVKPAAVLGDADRVNIVFFSVQRRKHRADTHQ